MKRKAQFEIVAEESTPDRLVIRDIGPWSEHPTITNDAENVVEFLANSLGYLNGGRRLFYYDSMDHLDEIIVKDGRFAGFKPGGHGITHNA